ncbi:MAG: N-6 DNA methylase [Prevotellaceae bacterium]|jgi:type I restriction-modification system DNA methylase subunit|nr:N-6 DNA methylase [Prevotellaceae bacterium]
MSEELLQRDLIDNPEKIGKWDFRNIGSTTLNALKNAGIIPKKDYKSFEKRKPDGIITSKKEVIAIVENKDTSKFKTAKQKADALKQGLDVAQVLNAKILILTDTVDTIWINAFNGEEILDEKGNILKVKFDYKNSDLPKLMEQIIDSIDKNNSQIKEPRLKDPTRLAKSVWQDLWMAAGATPENCLYSFVELFIFKYLSDLGILKEHLNYDFIMKMFEKEDENIVLKYYADNVRKHIKKDLFPVSSDDNTTIINGTIFVSKDDEAVDGFGTVFHKILRKFGDEKEGGGELRNIDKDFKSKLFETFLKESISKKNWGQYFTPLKVVRSMVKMAESEIKEGITICDPACGVGKFLLEPLLINNNIEHFYEVKNKKLIPKITLVGKDKGFDKEEQKTIILAKANMLIYMSDMIRKHSDITPEFSQLFNETFELKTKNILGTLRDVSYEGKIDLILTNPPYVTTGSSNLKEEIIKSNLQSHYKINAMGVEGLFMEWIIRALKPSGMAFVVVPDGIFNRQNDKNLRQYILDECFIDGIISLPLKTFFTTQKKTYILCLTKKQNKTEKQTDPVFTYLVSEIGESRDIYRFAIEQDDLNEAVDWFNQFKNAKKSFKFSDKRCKIQPIEKFDPESYWNIERWWSKEEQIKLGIVEEDKTIKFEELPELIEEVANNILSFKEEIIELNEKKKSNITFQTVKIGDIFNFPSTNSKITKEFCEKHKGNIPVYASSKDEESVLGYIEDNLPNIKYYENCLSWNRNGSVGYVFIRDHRFTTNEDHRAFVVKKEFENCLSKKYLKFIIEFNLLRGGFSFLNKCGLDKIQPIKIQIPINNKEVFDLGKQIELAEQYEYIKDLQAKIENYKKQIEGLNIEIETDYKYNEVSINYLFNFIRGRVISKKDLTDNAGEFPVYSSNTKENGIFGYLNSFDFDCEGITWTTDGIYAGTTFCRNGKFSITNVCGLMTLKKEFIGTIYLPFINAILNFRNIATGTANKKVMTNVILNSNIILKIPINSKGNFDLFAQQQIAEKYQKIAQIKKSISEELDKISKIEIDFE